MPKDLFDIDFMWKPPRIKTKIEEMLEDKGRKGGRHDSKKGGH